jgi:riboflavin synthase
LVYPKHSLEENFLFTGIIQGIGFIHSLRWERDKCHYTVQFPKNLLLSPKLGASFCIDGVCQTLTEYDPTQRLFSFTAIKDTLDVTTLNTLEEGRPVNIEPSLKVGDELGGHQVSGHIFGRVSLEKREGDRFSFSSDFPLYVIPKGFVAVDGISLTVREVWKEGDKSFFSISLIPHTEENTVFRYKKVGALFNMEFDNMTYCLLSGLQNR